MVTVVKGKPPYEHRIRRTYDTMYDTVSSYFTGAGTTVNGVDIGDHLVGVKRGPIGLRAQALSWPD